MILGIIGNTNKPKVKRVVKEFTGILDQKQIKYVYASDLVNFLSLNSDQNTVDLDCIGKACDIVVAFGGDGTILSTANVVGHHGVPILGVNSGGLGFLAEVMVDEIHQAIDDLLNKNYSIIDRMLLSVIIHQNGKSFHYTALNDVVVDKGLGPRLIYADVTVNNMFLNTYRSDGLIVASPTGSTAYSLSAGGPLLMPTMNAIIVTPICPHSLTERPIVLSEHAELNISIKPGQDSVQVSLDGQSIANLQENDSVEIKKAHYPLKWVSIGKRDFFEILRTKLNWGIDNPGIKKNLQERDS